MNGKNGYSATTEMVIIYSPEGEAKTMSRANAGDLVRHNGFTWGPPETVEQKPVPEPVADVEEDEPVVEDVEDAPAVEDTAELDYSQAPLADIAEQLIGSRDVAKYLTRFSDEQLRELAQSRFGERVHHAAKTDTIIEKIVGWEEELNGA